MKHGHVVRLVILALLLGGCRSQDKPGTSAAREISAVWGDTTGGRAPRGALLWQDSSRSRSSLIRLEDSTLATVLENHTYLRASTWPYHGSPSGIVIISQDIRWHLGPWEGNLPSLRATCYSMAVDEPPKALWSLAMQADEGGVHDNFYETTWYGCCGATADKSLFSLLTGRKVLEYTEDLLKVTIPNTPLERFIGYKCSETVATEPYEDYRNDSLYVGTLSYACRDSLISKVVLRWKPKQSPHETIVPSGLALVTHTASDRLSGGHELELWSANFQNRPERFTGFAVVMRFDDERDSVIIPVVNDRLVPSAHEHSRFTIAVLE